MIDFMCLDPDIAKRMPIIRASEINHEWLRKAEAYYENRQDLFKTTKCPGIHMVLNRGWIQRAYQDFSITTNGDNISFKYAVSEQQLKKPNGKYMGSYICSGGHPPSQLQQFKEWPTNTLHTVIKIQSPWVARIPKGYSLMTLPLPYVDETRFSSAIGLMKGTQFLNVQLYWHRLNSKEVIKAGTPLQQMLLVKNEREDYNINVVEDFNTILHEFSDKCQESMRGR